MEKDKFMELKLRFTQADLQEKIKIYTETPGLDVRQYKELLKIYPYEHISELEKGLAEWAEGSCFRSPDPFSAAHSCGRRDRNCCFAITYTKFHTSKSTFFCIEGFFCMPVRFFVVYFSYSILRTYPASSYLRISS